SKLGFDLTREAFIAHKDEFVIVTFDATDAPTPPPLPADLAWVWAVVLPLAGLMVLRGRRRRQRR
ncbi:MAG: hypothetical protein GYB67_18460, partial [Chloroflexi bacterium]|nr:hypothetical protein [Chloroflexota bacterium]